MYKQKLNPKILQHYKSKFTHELGFTCLLKLPKLPGACGYSSQIQRYSRLEEENYRKTLNNAATFIQKHIRKYLSQCLLDYLRKKKLNFIQNQKAELIQKTYKMYKAIKLIKYLKVLKKLSNIRESAAICIQKNLKIIHLKQRLHCLYIVSSLKKIRLWGAIVIQKAVRGYLVRKDMYFIRNSKISLIVMWKYPARTVSITGSFTYPAWKQEIPLLFSNYLKVFYSIFFLENNLQSGRYYLKFIVDGTWICDGNMPISQDLEGNYNNVITISREKGSMPRSSSSKSLDFSDQRLETSIFPRVASDSISSPRPISYFRNDDSNKNVRLCFGSFMASHPKKKNAELESYSSADAIFTETEDQIFGVADGVGEWESLGLDPGMFPKELMRNFITEFSYNRLTNSNNDIEISGYLENILTAAYNKTQSYGSSTVLVGMCRNNYLYTLCLGDSSYIILRPRETGCQLNEIYRSVEQQHNFNCPYQLSHMPDPSEYDMLYNKGLGPLINLLKGSTINTKDLPQDGLAEIIPLQPSDIIIAGSDGLFDNLFDSDILQIAENYLSLNFEPQEFCTRLSKELVIKAIQKGWDSDYKSPFSKNASKHGKRYLGGKLDDTSVIVAFALEQHGDIE
jgi:serine/threonine protein phosphatase PrpC